MVQSGNLITLPKEKKAEWEISHSVTYCDTILSEFLNFRTKSVLDSVNSALRTSAK